MARRMHVRTGIAGWSIASAHRGEFDAGTSMLARYATRFDTVEINSSFYRPHRRQTYERWAASTPRDFRFAVKTPRHVTHELALRRVREPVARFADECTGLGDKLGVILIQLPPSLAYERRVAASLFASMTAAFPAPVHLVCEARHPSWLSRSATALFRAHAIGRVGADPSPIGAVEPEDFGSCRYWRLHGRPRIYYSAYPDEALEQLAAQVGKVEKRPEWVVFDNTAHGHAIPDALRFKALVDKARDRSASRGRSGRKTGTGRD